MHGLTKAEAVSGLLHNCEGLIQLLNEEFKRKAPQSESLEVS